MKKYILALLILTWGILTFSADAKRSVVFLGGGLNPASIASNLVPSADDTYDIGSSSLEWKDLYLDGVLYVDDSSWSDGTDTHQIKPVQETGLGGRLTFGLDETARTMVICDVGDIDTDFGLSASNHPALYILDADANADILLNTGGDSYFNGGNVGIGTTSPGAVLQIDSGDSWYGTGLLLKGTGAVTALSIEADTDKYPILEFRENGVSKWQIGNDYTATDSLFFGHVGEASKMVIDSSGNVGIGDTSPGTLLQLKGADAYLTLQNSTDENTDGGAETRIIFEDHANAALAQIQGSHDGAADDTKGDLIFYTHTGSALTEAMRIDSSQDVTFGGGTATAQLILPLSNDATTPTLAFGDGNTGFYESSDNTVYFSVNGGSKQWYTNVSNVIAYSESSGGSIVTEQASATNPAHAFVDDEDTGLGRAAADALSLIAGGVEAVRYTEVSSAVLQAHESNVGLTADVGSAQGNGVITSSYNVYTTVGTAGDAATLPATAPVGTVVVIKNDAAANAMDVFPASGDDLGEGANTALSLAAGKGAMFLCTVADSTWTNILEGI